MPDFEILLVNNAPDDPPPRIFPPIRGCGVLAEGAPGSYAARNRGARGRAGAVPGLHRQRLPARARLAGGVSRGLRARAMTG